MFATPFGIGPGVCRGDATAATSLLEMGDLAFVELGPVTIDPQQQPSVWTNLIRI